MKPINIKKIDSNTSILNQKDSLKKKIKKFSVEFEAIFLKIMFKDMINSLKKDPLFGNSLSRDIFTDMLWDQYMKAAAKSGQFGFSKMIYNDLIHRLHLDGKSHKK